MYRPSCPRGARLKAKALEKGKVRTSPIEMQTMLTTKIPAQKLTRSKKKLLAITNDPTMIILIFGKAFRSKKPTVGISRVKIKSPFKVISKPVWNSLKPNFSL